MGGVIHQESTSLPTLLLKTRVWTLDPEPLPLADGRVANQTLGILRDVPRVMCIEAEIAQTHLLREVTSFLIVNQPHVVMQTHRSVAQPQTNCSKTGNQIYQPSLQTRNHDKSCISMYIT